MPHTETAQHQSYTHPKVKLPQNKCQSLNDSVTPCSLTTSSKRHQQQPTKPNGTSHQNPNLHPMELCAFCACQQQKQLNRRPLFFSALSLQQWPTHASVHDTNAFSIYHHRQQPRNGSNNDNGKTTTINPQSLALSFSTTQQWNPQANYYACLIDNKNDDEQDGTNASGDDNKNDNKFTNDNSHSTNNPQPSKPSSLHGISTLTSCLPSPVTLRSHMATNNMTSNINNGNLTHTQGKQTTLLSSFPSLSPPPHLNQITTSQCFQLIPDQSAMAPPNFVCKKNPLIHMGI